MVLSGVTVLALGLGRQPMGGPEFFHANHALRPVPALGRQFPQASDLFDDLGL